MLQAVIIGCGRIAGIAEEGGPPTTHVAAYRETPGVVLAACVDIDPDKAARFAARHGCAVAANLQEAMDAHRPELLSICTPDATHYQVARQVLGLERPPRLVFLEKPACAAPPELNELLALSAERGVEVVVNHTRRFDSAHRQLQKRIAAGEFGELYRADCVYYSGWQHNGVHLVDTLSFLFGDRLRIVKITGELPSPHPGDPTLEGELAFAQGPGRVVVSGMEEDRYQLFEFDLRFSRARLRIEDFGAVVRLERKVVNHIGENVLQAAETGLAPPEQTPMQTAVGLMARRLREGDPALLDGYRLADVAGTMQTIWEGQHARQA